MNGIVGNLQINHKNKSHYLRFIFILENQQNIFGGPVISPTRAANCRPLVLNDTKTTMSKRCAGRAGHPTASRRGTGVTLDDNAIHVSQASE